VEPESLNTPSKDMLRVPGLYFFRAFFAACLT
jgi:hypothetical protein